MTEQEAFEDESVADESFALPEGWDDRRPLALADAPHALSVEDLRVFFATDAGPVQALKGVSYEVAPGEILAVVGESGSGKSVSVRAILGMLPDNSYREGVVRVGGENIADWSEKRLREVRGAEVAMVFQEPGAALDPLFTVGDQIVETLRAHPATPEQDPEQRRPAKKRPTRQRLTKKAAKAKAVELLGQVRLPDPESLVRRYPHELSGGQKQRVAIALAISCDPKVILADEPTTALDVTVQAEILQLLADLRDRIGTAIVFITHNLGVVANFADRVVVMRAGEVVESGSVREVFANPQHEYTQALLAATPRLDAPPVLEPVEVELEQEAEPVEHEQEELEQEELVKVELEQGELVKVELEQGEPEQEAEPVEQRPEQATESEQRETEEATESIDQLLEAAKSGRIPWPTALAKIKDIKAGPRAAAHSADDQPEPQG